MTPWIFYLFLFTGALLSSLVTTPVAGHLALRLGCVDRPGGRKIHARNIPYFGGVAIFAGFMAVFLVTAIKFPDLLNMKEKAVTGFLCGGTLVLFTGLVDDFRSLRPRWKLGGQILAGISLAWAGVRIEFLTNPLGGNFHLGPVPGGIVTVLWVVAMVNAMNLIDGLDGLASGVALIGSLTLFAVAGHRGDLTGMVLTAVLAGSCLGFLRYNFFPARIFLGDAGSMFLGFVLSVVGIEGLQKGATMMALMIPLAALGVPVLDTLMAVIRRSKVKKNIFSADGEHLHHRLVRLGIREKKVVLLIYFFCIHLGLTAFVLTLIPSEYTLMMLALIAMGILFALKTLGFVEEKLAVRLRRSEQVAMVDRETGLPSFQYMSRRVIDEIRRCDRYGDHSFALLLFDLKGLQSRLSAFSDPEERRRCFQRIARFFEENVRATDVVSYMGGESFVVMTPEEGEGMSYLIERLQTIFDNTLAQEGTHPMTLKVRVVEYPGNGGIVQDLLRDAVEVA
ncbi:MAG: diguanylate cyclase [Deltaproteobacteria bacterium]|nr:diguanylate cyclase [Deltaproteobacteria bacterium]